MDVQLQELIDKIKKDGVATAESSAAAIIADAEKKAAVIISEAEEKSAEIIKTARAETERMEKASIDAIGQAGRNLLIAFKDGVISELDSLIKNEVTKAYNAELLKGLIPEVIKSWTINPESDSLSVLLSEDDKKVLEESFKSALKTEIAKGLIIKSDTTLSGGFKVGVNEGAAYYDFSAEAVADLFAAYLNPITAKILKEAVK